MTGVMTLYRSTVGKKVIMAVTGVLLLGFVLVHMWGNLKLFQGPTAINMYAEHLRLLGEPILGYEQGLWIARVVLLVAVLLHIWSAAQLWKLSNDGRPDSYSQRKPVQPAYTYAAYTMRWGGVLIALFIIFHILHFTLGVVGYWGEAHFEHPFTYTETRMVDGEVVGEEIVSVYSVYENVVLGFQVWPVALFYIIAQLALGLHIFHGAWSMFQTLGLNNESYTFFWRGLALVLALAIVVGNISLPVAVLAGIITL